jgi:hypothetical protein
MSIALLMRVLPKRLTTTCGKNKRVPIRYTSGQSPIYAENDTKHSCNVMGTSQAPQALWLEGTWYGGRSVINLEE